MYDDPTQPEQRATTNDLIAPYDALIASYEAAKANRRGAPRRFTDDQRKARQMERSRRASIARHRVLMAFHERYRAEYDTLYQHALNEIAAERGPLPGDTE